MEHSRRELLLKTLFGTGLIGLRALATGLPLSLLANPRRALAAARRPQVRPPTITSPQYIILSTSADGDPLNCNAPGTYLDPALVHPQSPSMAPTTLTLSGQSYVAAQPWSQLPQPFLDRTCFFHHGTYTVVHPDQQLVQEVSGATSNDEMLVSLLASQLAPLLGTVQPQPVVLGPRNVAEDVVYQSESQPVIAPSALARYLGRPTGVLGQLTAMRDRDLDSLNALIKSEGTPAQGAFIDQYVKSQIQIQTLSEDLLSTLQAIPDDSVSSQIIAAVTLIRMNVAPVVSLHIPFGGDNHGDAGLVTETSETISGVASLNQLWTLLSANDLQDRVSFLSLNVFGRTMGPINTNGRTHNAGHHVALMSGAPFRGSVIGGVEAASNDYAAMSIDSTTGAGVPSGGGNIPFTQTLQSMALTFAKGTGVEASFLTQNILDGTVVGAALAAD